MFHFLLANAMWCMLCSAAVEGGRGEGGMQVLLSISRGGCGLARARNKLLANTVWNILMKVMFHFDILTRYFEKNVKILMPD